MKLVAPLLLFLAACQQPASAEGRFVQAPPALAEAHEAPGLHKAIFSGGCFWGVEGVFSHVAGVVSAVSGYHGGASATARYERVEKGDTGHAESVLVTYDPAKVRYDQLLRIFFSIVIDPTQANGQGADIGPQYRTALVPMEPEQRRVAQAYLAQLGRSGLWHRTIATRIEPYRQFFPAEAEHQNFMARNPGNPYILYWDAPRIAALKERFPALYKAGFTLH